MNYLITGRNGQLAAAFIRRFESRSIEFFAPDESLLDITDAHKTDACVASARPDIILNCAAYNLVDKAEQEPHRAFSVNETGPRNLAVAAHKHHAVLVHYSSDYVFDGRKETALYGEGDAANPLNQYGGSKLAGEQAVREVLGDRSLVFRLSWVFGGGKQNFIAKLLEWSAAQEYLRIACDEFSVPTWTETVVDVTLNSLEQGVGGLYHLTNGGYCSRYEWAKAILRRKGIDKFIRPVPMDSFNLPAKRPKFSAMSNRTITDRLSITIPAWEEAVDRFLGQENRS
ncbi:MAG: dTDP-4-dehydrorhamnose reductase [Nitrospirota bacterium]